MGRYVKTAWIVILVGGVPFCVAGLVLDPEHRGAFAILGLAIAMLLAAEGFFRVMGSRAPVPNGAVKELWSAVSHTMDGWVVVSFAPSVSIDEARRKVGSTSYSASDRRKAFLIKLELVAATRPDVVVCYSSQKGLLAGRAEVLRELEAKYGRFMMNTWQTLNGALVRAGTLAIDIDGPQTVPFR